MGSKWAFAATGMDVSYGLPIQPIAELCGSGTES